MSRAIIILVSIYTLSALSTAALAAGKPLKKARVAFTEGEFEKAEELCAAVPEKSRDWRDARALIGEIRLRTKKVREAASLFAEVLAKDPRHVPSLVGAGKAAWRLRDNATAEVHLKAALKVDKKNVDALRELGRVATRKT